MARSKDNNNKSSMPMLYICECGAKKFKSFNTYTQHLNSNAHRTKLALRRHASMMPTTAKRCASNDSDNINAEPKEFNPLCCFLCECKFAKIEHSMKHMNKKHHFLIPDAEYLTDPVGFFTYVGLKVTKEFKCLWCSETCHPFQSLEAVRMHMIEKCHCRVHYGDLNASDENEDNLEDFYDYTSSYIDSSGLQLVVANEMPLNISLGSGTELVITSRTDTRIRVKILGAREYALYYRQQPRPTPIKSKALMLVLAKAKARPRVMGLSDLELSKQKILTMTVLRKMTRRSVDSMQAKIGTKNHTVKRLSKKASHR